MAESLIVRKAGGGAKIEENIQSYTVASGQTITPGTFVNIEYATSLLTSELSINDITNANNLQVFNLSNDKLIAFYTWTSNSNSLTARIITVNSNNTLSVGGNVNITSGTGHLSAFYRISETKGLLIYNNNPTQGYVASVINISGNTITVASSSNLGTGITNTHINSEIFTLTDGKYAFCTRHNSAFIVRALTVNANDTITQNYNNQDVQPIGTIGNWAFLKIAENTGLLIYNVTSDYNIRYVVYNFNTSTNSIAPGQLKNLEDKIYAVSFNTTKGFISFENKNALFYGNDSLTFVINKLNNNTITTKPSISNGVQGNYNMPQLKIKKIGVYDFFFIGVDNTQGLNYGNFLLGLYNGQNYTMLNSKTVVNTFSLTSIDANPITGNKLAVFYSNTSNTYCKIYSINKTVVNATGGQSFGLAKTGGTAGQTVEVYVNQ